MEKAFLLVGKPWGTFRHWRASPAAVLFTADWNTVKVRVLIPQNLLRPWDGDEHIFFCEPWSFIIMIPQSKQVVFDTMWKSFQTLTTVNGMAIKQTDLTDRHDVVIISSHSSVPSCPKICQCCSVKWPLSSEHQRLDMVCYWCLGITGMTTMLSLSVPPWEICRWHCISRVSLVNGFHTHSTADGNVSRTLQVMVTNITIVPTIQTHKEKWLTQCWLLLCCVQLFYHISYATFRWNGSSCKIHLFIDPIINILDLDWTC